MKAILIAKIYDGLETAHTASYPWPAPGIATQIRCPNKPQEWLLNRLPQVAGMDGLPNPIPDERFLRSINWYNVTTTKLRTFTPPLIYPTIIYLFGIIHALVDKRSIFTPMVNKISFIY